MTKAKVFLDSCIWSGAKQELTDAGYDVKWVGDFWEDPGDEVIIELAFVENRCLTGSYGDSITISLTTPMITFDHFRTPNSSISVSIFPTGSCRPMYSTAASLMIID